jgi:hypothetical protein
MNASRNKPRSHERPATMRIISIESKTVSGKEYSIIKGYSEAIVSKRQYKDTVEVYGNELVHFSRKGNIYDIIVTA